MGEEELLVNSGGELVRTYATWNPLDKHPSLNLSPDLLTVTGTLSGWYALRATMNKTSGIWSYAAKITALGAGTANLISGTGSGTASLTNTFFDVDTDAYYSANGQFFSEGSGKSYGAAGGLNIEVGHVIDIDDQKMHIFLNGVPLGEAPVGAGLVNPLFPLFVMNRAGLTVETSFGATDFDYPLLGVGDGVYTDA